jgi:hypothetical protein
LILVELLPIILTSLRNVFTFSLIFVIIILGGTLWEINI